MQNPSDLMIKVLSVKDIQYRLGMMGMFTEAGGGEVESAEICTVESLGGVELSVVKRWVEGDGPDVFC